MNDPKFNRKKEDQKDDKDDDDDGDYRQCGRQENFVAKFFFFCPFFLNNLPTAEENYKKLNKKMIGEDIGEGK